MNFPGLPVVPVGYSFPMLSEKPAVDRSERGISTCIHRPRALALEGRQICEIFHKKQIAEGTGTGGPFDGGNDRDGAVSPGT